MALRIMRQLSQGNSHIADLVGFFSINYHYVELEMLSVLQQGGAGGVGLVPLDLFQIWKTVAIKTKVQCALAFRSPITISATSFQVFPALSE